MAIPAADRMRFHLDGSAGRRRLAQEQGCSGGCVDLVPVVHFDNLDVEILPQCSSGFPHKGGQQIDPQTHIARFDDPGMARRRLDPGFSRFIYPRRADDMDDPGLSREFAERNRRGRYREVDDAVDPGEQFEGVAGDDDTESADTNPPVNERISYPRTAMPTGSLASTKMVSLVSRRAVTPFRTTGIVLRSVEPFTSYVIGSPSTRCNSESTTNGVMVMVFPFAESGTASVSSTATESFNGVL